MVRSAGLSCPSHAPAVVADGDHADTIDHCAARPAAESDLRDHAIKYQDEIGAGVIACADVATAKAKPATAINLIVSSSLMLLLWYDAVTAKMNMR
jgi:hypothetical protein